MRPQKLPHSIFCLTYLRGINGLKPNTVWQLTAADEGLRFISNMPFSKDEFIVSYDHLVYFRRRPDWYFQGIRNATARAIAGSALNGELGAVSAVMSGKQRLSDELGFLIYSAGVDQYNEDNESDSLDEKKKTRARFRWDNWRPGARGDESFFKTLVERCTILDYEGIEEFLDFKPL